MQPIVVVGSAGHARVVIDAIRKAGLHEPVGLIDETRAVGETTLGVPVLGGPGALSGRMTELGLVGVVVAIGDNAVRSRISAEIAARFPGLPGITVIHPSAVIGAEVAIGSGSVVLAGAVVNAGAVIGRGCIVNTQASLDHDATLADHASLAPGVHTGGGCRIGEGTAIGIGAVLLQRVQIGAHTVIGAGSLVCRDIGPRVVAWGRPAVVQRTRAPGDPYL